MPYILQMVKNIMVGVTLGAETYLTVVPTPDSKGNMLTCFNELWFRVTEDVYCD